ncbi:MAG: presqualene diphosphate synthase HpnD [Gammaproteobacteria bacterium]|nr:presqualene diphosphate synthase HpnD [Gammaproteobacteria bacterium]MCW8973941.1 presqualene diphosphate synthase HpnD [Gammaproteobacteria bacterium]MCW8993057.1 presqualene diphosphate synthase HpnD [Gammaproteobacteria bacterium]
MSPDDYCQDRTRRSGSSFYHSFRFLPAEKRRAITALYAFCREVDDVVDECSDTLIARKQLEQWREEVARLYQGRPEHPVTLALQPLLERYNLPQEYLLELIDGMEMDLEQTRYEDFSQLALYCYRVASVVGLLSAEIFGYSDRHTLNYAHDLGMAFQLTNILRDIREDAQRGRVYLPADEMTRFGVTREQIRRGEVHEGTRQLLALQAERAERFYQQAFAKLPEADRHAQRSGIIMAAIYRRILRRIVEEGYPVLERRVALPVWKKLWLTWRCYRTENRRTREYQRNQARPQ